MYDYDKAKQLEKQSHVRGLLSKQFYSNEQIQLEKKRKQMKRILDEQVEERKRVKQRQKQQLQRKHRKQEEAIKRYYEDVKQRQKKISDNASGVNAQKNMSEVNSNSQNQSLVKKHYQQSLKQRVNSKMTLQEFDNGNIFLMPVMAMSQGQINQNRLHGDNQNSHHQLQNSSDRQNAGNIPLLEISDESSFLKTKKKSKTHFKREKTERENIHLNQNQLSTNIKFNEFKNPHHQSFSNNLVFNQNQELQNNKKKDRRKTLSNEDTNSIVQQNLLNSRISKASKLPENSQNRSPSNTKRNAEVEFLEEIEQMKNDNKLLKSELKRSQEAISLLIGAVRSNPKFGKFRIQAEKILYNAENNLREGANQEIKIVQKKEQSLLLLPKLKIKHQSIMHDYLLQAAKRGRKKQINGSISKN